MTGWNLPPGCSVSDIPGNRPEDALYEEFIDELQAMFPRASDEKIEALAEYIMKRETASFTAGWNAKADSITDQIEWEQEALERALESIRQP